MTFRLFRSAIISVLLLVLGGVIGFQVAQGKSIPVLSAALQKSNLINVEQPAQYGDVDFSQFWEVWQILENKYLDPDKLNTQEQVYGAIGGMTSALGDPFTMYLPPQDQKRSTEDLAGSFYGIGVELGYKDQTLAVIAPLKGSPAERAGVQAGDLILNIKDDSKKINESTNDMPILDAVGKIRGQKGVPVTLTLYRDGTQRPFDITIERDEIVVPSVEVEFIEQNGKKAAHLTLSRFGDRTMSEWDGIVAQIVSEPNLDGVILDLRNNPGGYLNGAIDIASEFISDGVVVSQQGRSMTQKYTVSRRGKLTQIPINVLINKGSASASEIVAGALRDRRNAKLIGENTFGKGTVQDAIELNNGAGLHVTVGRWLLPNGDWIHEKGIPATVEVSNDPNTEQDEQLDKAVEEL